MKAATKNKVSNSIAFKAIEDFLDMKDEALWKELRFLRTSTWTMFKQTCMLLKILRDRNASQGRPIKEFYQRGQEETGYSKSYILSCIKVAENGKVMSIEDSVASNIDRDVMCYLSQKNIRAKKDYNKVFRWVRQQAIKGIQVRYAATRYKFYPTYKNKTDKRRFSAYSGMLNLTVLVKDPKATIEDVKDQIQAMLDSNSIFLNPKKTRQSTRRRVSLIPNRKKA